MAQFSDVRRIDALEFARLKAVAEWNCPFWQLPRLMDCIEQSSEQEARGEELGVQEGVGVQERVGVQEGVQAAEAEVGAMEAVDDRAASQAAGLRVRAQGASGPSGQALIVLQVSGRVVLRCQACLGLLDWDIDSEVTLELTSDPARLEAEPDIDEPYEPVLVSRSFDLLAEAESEALLCLPYIPRHEVCPSPSNDASPLAEPLQEDTLSHKPSPFAALAALKKPKG